VTSHVCIGSLDGDPAIEVLETPAATPVAFSPEGHLLFLRDGLMAQAFDARTGRLSGAAVRLLDAGSVANAPGTISQNGTLAFGRIGLGSGGMELTWFDRAGKEIGKASRRAYRDPSISPDGKRVAGQIFDESGLGDLWVLELERNVDSRFTFQPARRVNPIWSPDGTRIAYASNRDGGAAKLFAKRADGTGAEERLLTTDHQTVPTDWTADGRFIVYEDYDPRTGKRDLWMLPTSGDRKPVAYLQTPFDEFQGQVSPDGKWMAYGSDESGRWEIYVQPIPANAGKSQISNAGGTQPRWRRDGRELFYLSLDKKITSVDVKLGPRPEFGTPRALFPVRVLQNATNSDEFLTTPDGRRFLAAAQTSAGSGSQAFKVVLDWPAALRKR
jgi:dipeptidyl aminopeptidase/acylaminoacyl peptidase